MTTSPPPDLLRHMSERACKVFLALGVLRDSYQTTSGTADTEFPVSLSGLADQTGLAIPAVTVARRELVRLGLLAATTTRAAGVFSRMAP